MAYKDPKKNAEVKRRYYEANRDKYLKSAQESRARLRAYIRKMKEQPCHDCGIQYPHYVMEYDHTRGKKTIQNR